MDEREAIPIRELRNDVSQVMRRVEAGETVDVTRHGRRVARIAPIRSEKRPGTLADLIALREHVPAIPESWAEIKAMRETGGTLGTHLGRLGSP